MDLQWHLYLLSALFIVAGLNHFRMPKLYLKITPPFVPFPSFINYLVGFFEVVFGILLLISSFTKLAAWGIIFLLIVIFPANIYMYKQEKAALGLPKWLIIIRLPLQLGLILWTYQYTQN